MSGVKWTPKELSDLRRAYDNKKSWITENELASQLTGKFRKSSESIRWQLRGFRKEQINTLSRVLLLDIETLPMEGYFWGVWNQNISRTQIKKPWSIVCWSAKWLYDTRVYGEAVSPKDAMARNDAEIMGGIWEMINDATVVVTHNGNGFDLKKLNTRFLINGFPRPMYFKSVDTLQILRDDFSFTFNRMDDVNGVLGIGRKIETSFKWWDECAQGNKKYIDLMLKYNKQDVNILEELYVKLRPWMKGHPNMNLHSVTGGNVCPTCSGTNLHWNGTYETAMGLYKAFRCQDCGAIGRSTQKQYKLSKSVVQG